MLIRDCLASGYTLLNDAGEDELSYSVAVEVLASTLMQMRYERVFGYVDEILTKGELTITATTGIVANTLTNFGDPIYIEIEGQPIDECPASQLDLYATQGVQRAAFWTDTTQQGTKYVQLAIPMTGTIKIWYEPDGTPSLTKDSTVYLEESLKWCIAYRWAKDCIPYVKFRDPQKAAGLPVMALTLNQKAKEWKDIYIEKVNKIGVDRPFSKLPFAAGVMAN